MTSPTPLEFGRQLDELSRLTTKKSLGSLLENYGHAHNAGHERTVQEQARIRSTNPSTPTESIAASKASIRRECERADRLVRDSIANLEAANRRLMAALNSLDPPVTPEPLRYPRTVTNAELEESRGARERRREMGEAIP